MYTTIFKATSQDGTEVAALDEGTGPTILILHPGLDDGTSWRKVAGLLAADHRVLVLRRRQYRLDLPAGEGVSIADEVADIAALTTAVGHPVLLVGHSSGAVLALEALAALPSAFAGAVLYEPPVPTDAPLGGEALARAQQAIDDGKAGKAIQIFTRDMVKLPRWQTRVIPLFVALTPKLRRLAPRQIQDVAAIDALGVRLDTYAGIEVPTLLIGGERSPAHLSDRLDALGRSLPRVERALLRGQGHSANMRAPQELARLIADFCRTRTAGNVGRPTGESSRRQAS